MIKRLIINCLPLFLVSLALVVGGCGDSSSGTGGSGEFGIVSVSPAENAVNVTVNTMIVVTFSEELDPTSVLKASTFTLNPSMGGTVNCDIVEARFTPQHNLQYETTYSVTIPASIEDLDGHLLGSNYTWSFTTAEEP